MTAARGRRRKPILILSLVITLVVAAGVITLAVLTRPRPPAGPECRVPSAGGSEVELTAVNLQHASTINAVGLAMSMNRRARIIAVATAYQESTLRNLPDGDRDSVGLFQQRPSQGWGTVEQIRDPIYSAGIFYDRLVEVRNWQELPLTEAAQAVQYSGHPDAYAKWEDEATTLVDGLSGAAPLTLGCRAGANPSTAPAPVRPAAAGTEALPAAAADLIAAAVAELGGVTVDGVDGTSATLLAAIDDLPALESGRALAAWLVAHQTGGGVDAVTVADQHYADHRWSAAPEPVAPGVVVVTFTG